MKEELTITLLSECRSMPEIIFFQIVGDTMLQFLCESIFISRKNKICITVLFQTNRYAIADGSLNIRDFL